MDVVVGASEGENGKFGGTVARKLEPLISVFQTDEVAIRNARKYVYLIKGWKEAKRKLAQGTNEASSSIRKGEGVLNLVI